MGQIYEHCRSKYSILYFVQLKLYSLVPTLVDMYLIEEIEYIHHIYQSISTLFGLLLTLARYINKSSVRVPLR